MGPDFTGPSSTSRTVKPEIDTQGGHAKDFSRPLRSAAPQRGSVGQIGEPALEKPALGLVPGEGDRALSGRSERPRSTRCGPTICAKPTFAGRKQQTAKSERRTTVGAGAAHLST